jgi:putative endonuclease
MFTVYVLFSPSFNKIYIGFSSDVEQRILSHNVLATKAYTIRFRPWKLVYTETYSIKAEALKREKELKSARGRAFTWKLIHDSTGD